jgi:hypothetical protein
MLHALTHRLRLNTRGRTATLASLIGVVLLVTIGATAVLTGHRAKAAPTPSSTTVTVTDSHSQINALSSLAPAVGINEAAWDTHMLDTTSPSGKSVAGLLNDAGVQLMRYPGGGTADNFHWYNQSLTCVDHNDPPSTPGCGSLGSDDVGVNFDQFMGVVQSVGAQAMITVNYGTGTNAEAAAWVYYANVAPQGNPANPGYPGSFGIKPTYPNASPNGHNYGIKYWEIGNEVYGDGSYYNNDPGSHWELNHKPVGPLTYARGVAGYSFAMKSVDPSIKIGAVLTAPGNWPDAQQTRNNPDGTITHYPMNWDDTVLKNTCNAIDFVDVHWYPQAPAGSNNGTEDDAQLLAAPENGITDHNRTPSIASMMQTLRSRITSDCGQYSPIQIMITETNSVYNHPGRQTVSDVNALFAADDILTWLENGAVNVDWWAAHNSPYDGNLSSSLDGTANFGDFGILSTGQTSQAGAVEPPADTPFPTYFGLQMLHLMGMSCCNALFPETSSNADIAAHATYNFPWYMDSSGNFFIGDQANVLLINKSSTSAYNVNVSLYDASGTANLYTYGRDYSNGQDGSAAMTSISPSSQSISGSSYTVTVNPHTMVLIIMPAGGWSQL